MRRKQTPRTISGSDCYEADTNPEIRVTPISDRSALAAQSIQLSCPGGFRAFLMARLLPRRNVASRGLPRSFSIFENHQAPHDNF